MSYKHILVAVDLHPSSKQILEKALDLAQSANADISLLHLDLTYGEDFQRRVADNEINQQLNKVIRHQDQQLFNELLSGVDYPIHHLYTGRGDIADSIRQLITTESVDLVVCGHHHDLWHNLFSASGELMNRLNTDLFVVSLR
jgi:universal stress protein A